MANLGAHVFWMATLLSVRSLAFFTPKKSSWPSLNNNLEGKYAFKNNGKCSMTRAEPSESLF